MASSFERADAFVRDLRDVCSEADLGDVLKDAGRGIGFRYFALTHHVDVRLAPDASIRLHNYPAEWVDYYDAHALSLSDPVHRASHRTTTGFPWSELSMLIALTPQDREVLALGAARGIGDGFTVPANVPGESNGSCSFANPDRVAMDGERIALAQLLGSFAFEAARKLWRMRCPVPQPILPLTDRQRDCLVWAARGKTNWEIGRILGVEQETVRAHLDNARERLDATNRTSLVVVALYAGIITLAEVMKRS